MSRLKRAVMAQLDLKLQRFHAFLATSDEELAGCIEVLEAVRRQELNRVAGDSVVTSHAFGGQDVEQRLYGCRVGQGGQVVACMVVTPAAVLADIEKSREEYRLDTLPPDLLNGLVVMTRLAVLPPYRGTVASLALFSWAFSALIQEGHRAALLACEPGLIALYTRLGARPIGPVRPSPSGGFRLPMVCIPDPVHLAAVKSPLRKPLERAGAAGLHEPVTQWYEGLVAREGAIRTGITPYRWEGEEGTDEHESLTSGMSPAGIRGLLKSAQVVVCQPGDVILAADDGGRFLGIVRAGAVEVRRDGVTVAVLGEGEVFGELATILGARRTADVLAVGDDTEVVLLTRSALDHVTDPSDRAALWQNLARILAVRLATTDD